MAKLKILELQVNLQRSIHSYRYELRLRARPGRTSEPHFIGDEKLNLRMSVEATGIELYADLIIYRN